MRRGERRDGPRHREERPHRTARAGHRRRAHLQLRRLRDAGAPPRLRRQRLRRDAAGAVGVGRQAARRQRRRRRRGERRRAQGRGRGGRARAPPPIARPCATSPASPRSRRGTRTSTWPTSCSSEASRKRRGRDEKALDKIRRRTSAQVAGKLTERVDGELRFKSLPPLVSPLRDLVGEDDADQVRELILRAFSGYRSSLAPGAPPAARPLPPRRRGPQGGRRRQRRHALPHRLCSSATATTTCSSCSSRKPTRSVLEPYAGRSQYRQNGARVVNGQRAGAGGQRRLPRLERPRGGTGTTTGGSCAT